MIQPNQTKQPYVMQHPQAIAWFVVLSGFVVFCGICLSATLFSYWFLFSSHVGMNVSLTVSRGVMNITYPDGTDTSTYKTIDSIDPNFKLTTIDNSSQGYLSFQDNYSNQLIASVNILADSSATLGQGDRPRFEWSRSAYVILLNNVTGRFVVNLPPNVTRPIDLTLRSNLGEAHFTQAGVYSVDLSDSVINLTPNQGAAELRTPAGQIGKVSAGHLASLTAGQQVVVQPVRYEVLNPDFGKANLDQPDRVLNEWACTNEADFQDEPLGSFLRRLYNGQVVLNMSRLPPNEQRQLNHAETSCQYTFVPRSVLESAFDLRGHYNSLAIRATFQILGQDVSTCGVKGSECPLMLELTYLGAGNSIDSPAVWRHGFYALRSPNDLSPSSCDTCSQDHEKISQNAWYTYDSGDLLKLLPDLKKPEQIIRVRVYSSGHLYDVIVSDLQVIAGLADGVVNTTP